MRGTCFYVSRMQRMIQIRNVPDALHRRLKSRAALAGQSLSEYLLPEIREAAERPTMEELRARLATRKNIVAVAGAGACRRAERNSA